jgi:isoleucyl-tRNA synthetase
MSYPVESWFIKTTSVKDKMVALNKKINWKPETTGTGRFGTWLENNVDWAVSRQRYWGTPIPIWVSDEDPDYIECIGSIEELKKKAGLAADTEIDLHRPYIDDITWDAPNGGTMRRIPDLLDVWFDSGAMPFAQWHYPFQNKDTFKTNFPADFIAEGVDQTRGWFYTLHALATMLFDKPAYKNVVSNGLVLDENGEKMSKSKGNSVDPFEMLQTYGADTVRWYMMSNSSPWENLKFSTDGLSETQRKFFNTIVNIYSFYAMYANIDGFRYSGSPLPVSERPEMDRWINSRLNTTVKLVDEHLEDYEPTKAAREIEKYIEELSNWYVRRNRRRFWKEGKSIDKTSAYQTLYECLVSLAKLISPIAPFFGEWLYQQLNDVTGQDEISVHLSFYPTVEETAIDKQLERKMQVARTVSTVVLRIRNQIDINVRQPLSKIILPLDKEDRAMVESVKHIILDEVNVKDIRFVEDDSGIVSKSAKPNYPVLGKKLGKKMKPVAKKINSLTTDDITDFEEKGYIDIDLENGEKIRLTDNELEVHRTGLEGWSVETQDGITVAVDTELTPGLLQEGISREFINRVQNMRKEADFEVTDRITIGFEAPDEVTKSVNTLKEYIKEETLAEEIDDSVLDVSDFVKIWDIEGKECKISIRRNMNH